MVALKEMESDMSSNPSTAKDNAWTSAKQKSKDILLLMEEILHHLGYMNFTNNNYNGLKYQPQLVL